MTPSRILSFFLLIAGILILISGLASVTWYVIAAVVIPWGGPDQSLLFWHLPFLLGGSGLVAVGGAAIWLARERLRRPTRAAK